MEGGDVMADMGIGQGGTADVQQLTVRVPRDVHDALRTLAFAPDRKINDIVLCSIRDYLGSQGHRDAVEGFLGRARESYRVALDKLADL